MAGQQPGYEVLPIYKLAMAIAIAVEKMVRSFSRFHKYTFGARLRDTSMDTVILVGRAYRKGAERGTSHSAATSARRTVSFCGENRL